MSNFIINSTINNNKLITYFGQFINYSTNNNIVSNNNLDGFIHYSRSIIGRNNILYRSLSISPQVSHNNIITFSPNYPIRIYY